MNHQPWLFLWQTDKNCHSAIIRFALYLFYYIHNNHCRWSFLIGDEPCTVINKPPKPESPVIEEVDEEAVEGEASPREENQQIEVVIEEVQEEKEEAEEKAEVEATKVCNS